jgi:hypothetical protein
MKINRIILIQLVSIVLFLSLVTSCKKEEQGKNYSYFVSKQFAVEYNKGYINNLIDLVSRSVPEVTSVKPLVTSDINVYKLVYKTTVNGTQIDASGLICVPVNPGDYPVLSFQNGTNTVNANAPSEF